MKAPSSLLGPLTVRTGGRIWRMLLAAAIGWLAGLLASLPVQIAGLVRVAAGDERLLLDSMAYGLLVWGLVTLAIAIVSVVIVLGPVATMISARWVVRHPIIAVGLLPFLSVSLVTYRFSTWYVLQPGPYVLRSMYLSYAIFILVFFAASAVTYLRLVRRGLERLDALAPALREFRKAG